MLVQVDGNSSDDVSRRLASACRDGGAEVIYAGFLTDPGAICRGAIQEDADVILLSGLSGDQTGLLESLTSPQHRENLQDVRIAFVGNLQWFGTADMRIDCFHPGDREFRALIRWLQEPHSSEQERSST